MKKWVWSLFIFVPAFFLPGLRAVEVGMPLELLSAYVFRGETRNDGAVAQPALEFSGLSLGEMELPLIFGIWANFDFADGDGSLKQGEFSEVDLYLLGRLPIPRTPLLLRAGYWEYLFPGIIHEVEDAAGKSKKLRGEANRELSLGLECDTLLHPTLTCFFGLDGAVRDEIYLEGGVFHCFDLFDDHKLRLDANLGYLYSDQRNDGFKALTLSIEWQWHLLYCGFDYIYALDDQVLPKVEKGGNYDVKFVGRLGLKVAL